MRIEIRSNKVVIDGYVNAICRDSKPLLSPQGLFVEQIKEGVFQRALDKAHDVKLLFNHDENRELGSILNGNLQLFEDNIGLRAICSVDDPEVMQKAKDGTLKGWSFGFYTNSDHWENAEPHQRRYIEDMELLEVSILDKTPAYNGTSIEARADKNILVENRGDDFKAIVEDITSIEKETHSDNVKDQEDTRSYDNSKYIIEMLRLKQNISCKS